MPENDLEFTALYEMHYHNYTVETEFSSCTDGGTVHYTCECGEHYDEVIEPAEHIWEAITGPSKKGVMRLPEKFTVILTAMAW